MEATIQFLLLPFQWGISLFLILEGAAISDPVQMTQNTASDQGLHFLLTGICMQNVLKMKAASINP